MSSSSDIAIHASNLGKRYELYSKPADRLKQSLLPFGKQYYLEHWALRDVSFDIRVGESVGIIGRNGSGKSTLLQLVTGIIPATTGEAWTRGRVAALLELGSGFNPEFTGRENVYLNATILGLDRKETDAKFADIVEFAEIGEFIDQPVKTYSSGMFVRLAFSVIAHVDADVLIIDEALAVGDAFFVQKCMRYMRSFQEKGTLLFVSHDTSSVTTLCDRTIWISEGGVEMEGDSKSVCEAYFSDNYSQSMGISRRTDGRKSAQISGRKTPAVQTANGTQMHGTQKLQGVWFDHDSLGFGTQNAQILDVALLDEEGNQIDWLAGGEQVKIRVTAKCLNDIESPIIGFHIKDRLGQPLMGDNTRSFQLGTDMQGLAGQEFIAEFSFPMPLLLTGEYTIGAAIASGSMESHVQHHWMHDALVFKVDSSSLAGVLVGIPMTDIQLSLQSSTE
jgi:lipopolysaccharide transport system ATP-binding protein